MKNIKRYEEHLMESKRDSPEMEAYSRIVWPSYADPDPLVTLKKELEAGLDPNMTDEDGKTLIGGIIHSDQGWGSEAKGRIIEELVKAGADPNMLTSWKGWMDIKVTPLMAAVSDGKKGFVELLLRLGADPNGKTDKTPLPLAVAVRMANTAIVKLLLDAGAKADAWDKTGGSMVQIYLKMMTIDWTWLTRYENWAEEQANSPELLKMLIDAGADPNKISVPSEPPIMWASRPKFRLVKSRRKRLDPIPENVRVLLEGGADPNAEDARGLTALFVAADWNQKEIVRMLLDAGADPNHDNGRGRTPLWDAGKNSVIVRELIKAGADAKAVDPSDGTPLLKLWVKWDYKNSAKELVKAGADLSSAFDSLDDVKKFFGEKTSWIPEASLQKIMKRQRSRGAFGRF